MPRATSPLMAGILQTIMDNPGISGEEIVKRFPEHQKNTVSGYIQRLRMQGHVENQGNGSRGSAWVATSQVASEVEYIDVARDIMTKMAAYPIGLRDSYLAMRIQELATGRPTLENAADLANQLEEMAARLRQYQK